MPGFFSRHYVTKWVSCATKGQWKRNQLSSLPRREQVRYRMEMIYIIKGGNSSSICKTLRWEDCLKRDLKKAGNWKKKKTGDTCGWNVYRALLQMVQLIINQRRIDCVYQMEQSRKFASVLDAIRRADYMMWWVLVSECYICTHLNIYQVIRKFYISGSRCLFNISVWEVCPIIAHFNMADS